MSWSIPFGKCTMSHDSWVITMNHDSWVMSHDSQKWFISVMWTDQTHKNCDACVDMADNKAKYK